MKKIFVSGCALLFLLIAAGCNNSSGNSETTTTEEGPAIVIPSNDGALALTAENGVAIGTEIKYMPEWKAFGWFRSEDRVEWTVDVQKAGEYKATMEWSVSDEEAGKEFLLEAGKEKIVGTVEKSGSWEAFTSAEIGSIRLAEGRQKIIFRSNQEFDAEGALLDLRHVILQPVTP